MTPSRFQTFVLRHKERRKAFKVLNIKINSITSLQEIFRTWRRERKSSAKYLFYFWLELSNNQFVAWINSQACDQPWQMCWEVGNNFFVNWCQNARTKATTISQQFKPNPKNSRLKIQQFKIARVIFNLDPTMNHVGKVFKCVIINFSDTSIPYVLKNICLEKLSELSRALYFTKITFCIDNGVFIIQLTKLAYIEFTLWHSFHCVVDDKMLIV